MVSQETSIQSLAQEVLTPNYGQRNMALVRGEGIHVWDSDGRRYVDLLSGLGVNNLGHCHPEVVKAIQKQAQTLLHVSNLYLIEPQVQLADMLIEHSPADRVFFCNSGTEAVEAALKLARRYSFDKFGAGRHKVIALDSSFHGRTMGSLSATGQPKYHQGFEPLLDGFVHVPLNDIDALKAAMDDSVCAVIIEPIQGEGGIYPCQAQYLRSVRELCDQKNLLLIFDEVQCGLGRAGALFCSDLFDVEPDIITLAKGLAGGVAIGAMLAKEEPAKSLVPGTHAATFGGNPLACAAGIAAFNFTVKENLPQRSKEIGANFISNLNELKDKYPQHIREVRGMGLMIGVELTFPSAEVIGSLLNDGFITGPAGPNVLRFLPPLIVDEQILSSALERLDAFLAEKN